MKKILTIAFITLCINAQAQKSIAQYKITWCGFSGHIKKSRVDSLLNANCKKLQLTTNDPGLMILEYTCIITPAANPAKPTTQPNLPGGMFFPFINRFLKDAKHGDKLLFKDINIRKNAEPAYIEQNQLEVIID
jgi:hypothetical protein